MKLKTNLFIYPLLLASVLIMLTTSCKEETYDLTLESNPIAGGVLSGAGDYEEGTAITLSATPNQGYIFISWTNGDVELSTNATYIFSMPASNASLTANFEQLLTDGDGNIYSTIIIGTQEWMAENLKTSKYRDGSPIPTGLDNAQWYSTTTGAYAIYPHASINGLGSDAEVLQAYGALYNRYAVNTGNLCPTGWHVPTLDEWTALTTFLGGETVAGGKLKSTSTYPNAHPFWASPNTGATNESGFSALPGGYRTSGYGDITSRGFYWTSTTIATQSRCARIHSSDATISLGYDALTTGFSVRCIKD
jgi:uncharacterized protein (TIGR02145 family)